MSPTPFRFDPLREEHLPLLADWLNRPHVREWWHGSPTLRDVRAKYLPRIAGGPTRPYLAYLDGAPAGYAQSYEPARCGRGWWPDESDPGARGIDLFLGDPRQLDRGLGTAMVAQFVTHLFRDPAVTRIQVDPRPSNLRAIRCYEKAGFAPVGPVETPDGSALLMVIERPAPMGER